MIRLVQEWEKFVTQDADGSFIDSKGEVRYFSQKAFENIANNLERCFLCGIDSAEAEFNNEHVIPNWILRRFAMHSEKVTLPNGREYKYGQYTIRCCVSCNQLLGEKVETPMSELFSRQAGVEEAFTKSGEMSLIYQWLCLLFIKAHLKDRDIRFEPDLRRDSHQIADSYDWTLLHHIHTVARASKSRAIIDSASWGSIGICNMRSLNDGDEFDFGTLSDWSTIYVRVGDYGIIGVLNDTMRVYDIEQESMSGITGPLTNMQLRELAARFAYRGSRFKSGSRLWSELHPDDSLYIRGEPPLNRAEQKGEWAGVGEIMVQTCGPLIEKSENPQKLEQIRRGEYSFLFHEDGTFIDN